MLAKLLDFRLRLQQLGTSGRNCIQVRKLKAQPSMGAQALSTRFDLGLSPREACQADLGSEQCLWSLTMADERWTKAGDGEKRSVWIVQ